MNTKNTNKNGTTYTRVVFLMSQNPYTDAWEAMALFPDIYWDVNRTMYMSYSHVGQHGPCCEAYALLDCIAPKRCHKGEVERLKKELENLDEPYSLEVVDAAEWLASKSGRKSAIKENVRSMDQTSSCAVLKSEIEEDKGEEDTELEEDREMFMAVHEVFADEFADCTEIPHYAEEAEEDGKAEGEAVAS